MGKKRRFIQPIVVFIIAQIAWVSLVGLWIYVYMSNYFILKQVGDRLSIEISFESLGVGVLIGGFILLLLILGGIYLIFVYLTKQVDTAKSYDSFIESVTHELKSPIASIQLYLETMRVRDVEREKSLEFIDLMMKDVERLKTLINTILDVSKLEQKRMVYEYNKYTFKDFMIDMVNHVAKEYGLKDNQIKIEERIGNKNNYKIVADRNAMEIVVRNIIDNAIKYSIGNLSMTVILYKKNKYMVVDFIDSGIGIPQRERKRVFKKFVRLGGKAFPSVKGTGLGLYIVQEIMRYHNGRVDVFSRGVGYGATFRLEFPIYEEREGGRLKILRQELKW